MERRGATGSHGCGSVARGELGTGREREGLDLGELEVGVEVLTVGSIELWWLIVGDRGFEDVGAEKEEIGRRERMSGTEQGAQGGDLAPSLLSVGARPACRWPLLLSCHHGSRPSRPYTSTAGQSHGQGACKAADDCGARKTVLPLAEARAGVAVPPPSGDAAAAPTEHGGLAGQRLGWSLPSQREQGGAVVGRVEHVSVTQQRLRLRVANSLVHWLTGVRPVLPRSNG